MITIYVAVYDSAKWQLQVARVFITLASFNSNQVSCYTASYTNYVYANLILFFLINHQINYLKTTTLQYCPALDTRMAFD